MKRYKQLCLFLLPYKTVRIEEENVTQFDGMAFLFLL